MLQATRFFWFNFLWDIQRCLKKQKWVWNLNILASGCHHRSCFLQALGRTDRVSPTNRGNSKTEAVWWWLEPCIYKSWCSQHQRALSIGQPPFAEEKYSRRKYRSAVLSDRSGLKNCADRNNLKEFKMRCSRYIQSVLPPNPCLGKSSVDSFSDTSSSQEWASGLASPSSVVPAEQSNFCCLFC